MIKIKASELNRGDLFKFSGNTTAVFMAFGERLESCTYEEFDCICITGGHDVDDWSEGDLSDFTPGDAVLVEDKCD